MLDFDEIFIRVEREKEEKKSVLRIFEKFRFLRKRKILKVCTFGLTLTPVSPWRWPKSNKITSFSGKTLSIEHGSWAASSRKILVPALSSFAAIGAKGRVCKILTHFFKYGCFSRYHPQIFYKNKFEKHKQKAHVSFSVFPFSFRDLFCFTDFPWRYWVIKVTS